MSSTNPESVKKFEYTHFEFHHKLISKNRRGHLQVRFSCPNICAVCGEKEILKFYRVNDKDGLSQYFIKIGLCRWHRNPDSSSLKNILILGFVFFLIAEIVIFILTREFMLITAIILFFIMFCLFLYFFIPLAEREEMLKDYITFQNFSNHSVISIKNPRWTHEFKKLNICSKINPELDEFEEKMKKVKRFGQFLAVAVLGILFAGIPIALIISLIINLIPDIYIIAFMYLYFGLLFSFVFSLMTYVIIMDYKMRSLRAQAYFRRGIKPY